MSEQKPRPLSVNEQEVETLKETFADNEYLLKAVRALFLGFKVSNNDAELVRTSFKSAKVKEALRKKMFPTITSDVAIGEASDYWFGTEGEIQGKPPEIVAQILESKQECLEMLKQAFKLLDDPTGESVKITYSPDSKNDPFGIKLLARNKYIRTIETGLTIVKVIAGQKKESPQEALERLKRDSTK